MVMLTGTVVVLNAGYEPLHRVSVKHAVTMLARGVAIVEEAIEGAMIGPWQKPRSVRLLRYVAMRWRQRHAPAFSKEGVKRRDGYRCAYCRAKADTVDHVLPACRGGLLSWENTVAACRACNNAKGDRTPEEWGRPLLVVPAVPAWPTYTGYPALVAVA